MLSNSNIFKVLNFQILFYKLWFCSVRRSNFETEGKTISLTLEWISGGRWSLGKRGRFPSAPRSIPPAPFFYHFKHFPSAIEATSNIYQFKSLLISFPFMCFSKAVSPTVNICSISSWFNQCSHLSAVCSPEPPDAVEARELLRANPPLSLKSLHGS